MPERGVSDRGWDQETPLEDKMTALLTLEKPTDHAPLEVVLRDGGRAVLRPMAAGETAPLDAVFAGMSSESRASRYLVGLPRLPESYRRALTDLDACRHVAWLAEIEGVPAGIARFVRLPGDAGIAEFAFEVVDEHHGRGLAGVLLDVVTMVAIDRGVETLRANVAPDNVASRRLVTRGGAKVRLVEGILEVEGPLRAAITPLVDRALVLRLQHRHDHLHTYVHRTG